jgi:hypothetical protein
MFCLAMTLTTRNLLAWDQEIKKTLPKEERAAFGEKYFADHYFVALRLCVTRKPHSEGGKASLCTIRLFKSSHCDRKDGLDETTTPENIYLDRASVSGSSAAFNGIVHSQNHQ